MGENTTGDSGVTAMVVRVVIMLRVVMAVIPVETIVVVLLAMMITMW